MTQIVFELGGHPKETGVYVNPDVRWSLQEIAEEIINLGEEEFLKRHCYYKSKNKSELKTDAFNKYQPGNYHGETFSEVVSGVVRLKDSSQPVINTASGPRKSKYAVKAGEQTLIGVANKVQMVYQILSYLIETEGYSPEDLNTQYKLRYFKFPLLRAFPRKYDRDQMKEALGKDAMRFGLKYLIEAEGQLWAPCSQWNPTNTTQFINDMLKFNEVIDKKLEIIEI